VTHDRSSDAPLERSGYRGNHGGESDYQPAFTPPLPPRLALRLGLPGTAGDGYGGRAGPMWTGCYSSAARNGWGCAWRRSAICLPSAIRACARVNRRGPAAAACHQTEQDITPMSVLRDELLSMLSAMPGPDCPDPLPGTWCPPGS
jgi:hypothetical protein